MKDKHLQQKFRQPTDSWLWCTCQGERERERQTLEKKRKIEKSEVDDTTAAAVLIETLKSA